MIDTVFHVADIHIKKANHDHIMFSWHKLIDLIVSHSKHSILIIAGDIFDHKMYLEASDITLFNKMLRLLNDNKIRTFMMPGNHDYNINGANDDKIKALMESNPFEYVRHFSTSETCDYENLSICFHSPIDGGRPKPSIGKKSIAVVHEPITGSKTDGGIVFRKQRFGASDFTNDFHMTMIGDIHLPQVLAPNVAYCGSFVQTNRGEGIEHGCMMWNVETGLPTFIPLEQLSVHVRIFASEDKIRTVMPNVIARSVNLYHENCSESFLKSTNKQIKKQFNRELDSTTNKTKTNDTIEKATTSEINKLLVKQLRESNVCQEQISRVVSIHAKLFDSIGRKFVHDWKIKFLSWSNLYCYGENNYINFDNLTNLSAIVGPNKTGKSSVIDILILALFNETIRGTKKHALNIDSTKGFIKCVISVGKDVYLIERAWIDRNSNVVRLYLNDRNISGTDINETYKKLGMIVGSKKLFVNSVAALQHRKFLVDIGAKERYDLICRMMELDKLRDAEDQNFSDIRTAKKQLSVLKVPEDKSIKLLDAIKKQETNSVELTKLSNKITELRNRQVLISGDIIASCRKTKLIKSELSKFANLQHVECDADKVEINLAEMELSVRIIKQEIITIEDSIRTIPSPPTNLKELREKANCVGDISAIAQEIIELKTNIATAKAIISNKPIVGNNFTILSESHFEEMDSKIDASQYKIENLQAELLSAQFAHANNLVGEKMVWNGSCEDCCRNKVNFSVKKKNNLDSIQKLLNTEITILDGLKEQIVLEKKQNEISVKNVENRDEICRQKKIITISEKSLKLLSEQYYNLTNAAKIQNELELVDRNIEMLRDLNKRKEDKNAKLRTDMAALVSMRKQLDDFRKYEKNRNIKTSLEEELMIAEQSEYSTGEMYEISAEISSLEKKVAILSDGKLTVEIANLRCQIESDKRVLSDIEKIKHAIVDMELYHNIINHKNGLPVKMMENTCKGIENSANEILAVIADFTISIVFDKEIHINIGQVSAEQSSGYQKFVIDLILRQVLCTLTLSAHPRILFIDEGFGSLDAKNFEIVCREMLPRLASRFEKVIIISHVPTIHNHIPTNCVIRKIDERSHIQFGVSNAELITTKLIDDFIGEKSLNRTKSDIKKKVKAADELTSLAIKANEAGMSIFERISDKELRCKVCDRIIKVRSGSAEKHIASAGHIKKFKK